MCLLKLQRIRGETSAFEAHTWPVHIFPEDGSGIEPKRRYHSKIDAV